MSIIYTLLIFSVVIFFHELGHFVVARLCGVKVNEFSLGMGPAIFKYQGKETLYALRILPMGGYAAMEGENGEFGEFEETSDTADDTSTENLDIDLDKEETDTSNSTIEISDTDIDTDVTLTEITEEETIVGDVTELSPKDKKNSRSFSDKSVLQRILICAAGPVMNFILAFVVIMITLIGVETFSSTTIAGFKENSNTNLTGLRENDTITKINGVSILTDRDIIYEVLRDVDSNGVFDIEVLRDGNKIPLKGVTFNLVQQNPDEPPAIVFDFYVTKEDASGKVLKRGFNETYTLMRSSIFSVVDLVAGRVPFSELSGPVGVGQVVGQAAKISFDTVLSLAAMISVSIGILNLCPFPALDGGRIVFYMIEGIRGKPVSPKIEGYINGTGMILLLILMVFVTFKDVISLF